MDKNIHISGRLNTMTRTSSKLCMGAAMLLAAVTLSAQDAAQKPAGKMDKMGKAASFTGCVAAGATAGTYELKDAMPAMAKSSADSTDHSKMDHPMGPLMLMGTEVDLAPHVGHKVTVTGTTAGHMKGSDKMKDDKAKDGDKMAAEAHGRSLTVTSLTMVSATCN
jgi:hypothetical protein